MVKVKICGITNVEDAMAAVAFGADALGFVFYEGSPRVVTPAEVRVITSKLPPFVSSVGVFVNETPSAIKEIMDSAGLDVVQLHGDEPGEMCQVWKTVIKAFRVKDLTDLDKIRRYQASAYLLDAYTEEEYGGTGKVFNWEIAYEARQLGPIILAGGLNVGNIEEAVRRVRPYGVDVSSGVEETKRSKDHAKIKEFVERAKGA